MGAIPAHRSDLDFSGANLWMGLGDVFRAAALQMKNRLKVLRAERNWSQAELADRLEVSRQSVNAIETGKYDPSLPLAFRIAELFALPIEEIFLPPSRLSSKAI